jgi:Ca-activated chloride channel family protein
MIFGISIVQAQEKTITGIVYETFGPLPGVNVLVQGTTNGVQTDFDGKYSIKASIGDTLVFTYLGYQAAYKTVGKASIINVTLIEDAQILDEIVVVGNGTSTRSYTTRSSVSSIQADQNNARHRKINNALQGRVSGVQITNQRNTSSTIKIRGNSSISKNKEPLYIVDGVAIKNNYNSIIKDFDKDDIQKINVYKSYKAKKLFGNAASNGCIVITTKKGNYRLENEDTYAQIHENKFKRVQLSPLSTFSIDVDKASYIVVYAGVAGVVLKPTSGNEKEKILNALNNLESVGSTAGGKGIELAYKLAEKNFKKNGNNRVILATDGDFNVGASSNENMKKLITEKRETGVFLSVLGFGYGNYKDSKLEILADKGNGNHAFIDTMQEAQKVFGQEFGGTLNTIAKDVKIQVEFNPNKVKGYRLIGYENRLLNDEDFIDDTIDAGELGAGHKVTALYEVILAGTDNEFLKEVPDLKYTVNNTKSSTNNNELFTVKFRYKKPSEDKSIEMIHIQNDEITKASEDMKFATAVALFGLKLRKSQYINEIENSTIIELANNGRGEDVNGYRAEFIRLVKSIFFYLLKHHF